MTAWRRNNWDLLTQAVRLVDQGHYNDTIRYYLARIFEVEGRLDLAEDVRRLPDRTVCGVEEAWVYGALETYCREELARCKEVVQGAKEKGAP